MRRALVDTDIFSEVLKDKDATVRQRVAEYREAFPTLTISAVTVMEIVKGLHKAGREPAIERLSRGLDQVEVIPVDTQVATLAGRIYGDLERTGQPIGRADPMVAASALVHGCALVTGNTAHFERIVALGHALTLENWREPT